VTAKSIVFYVLRRIVAMAVLLLIVSFGVFSLMHLAPGDTVQVLLGTRPASPQLVASLRAQYHLNDPFFVQYLHWLADAVHLDFGRSIKLNEPVLTALGERMPITLFYGVYAFIISTVVGVSLGVLAAVKKRSVFDRGAVAGAVLGVSAPTYAVGLVLLYAFALQLGWFPVIGPGSGFADRFWHLTLPAITLATTGTALTMKMTRAALIDALDQDAVFFARARGVSGRRILFVYGLRNALMPIITAAGIVLTVMFTGAVLTEVTFALPGVGTLLIDSISSKDIPMVQGTTLLVAVLVVAVNLIIDLLYLVVDPRVRITGSLQ